MSGVVLYGTKYSRVDQVKAFKGRFPQILLGPLLNTLSHIFFRFLVLCNERLTQAGQKTTKY